MFCWILLLINFYDEHNFLGHQLAKLPMDPRIGKIILLGPIFRCMRPSLIIASAMVYHDPFVHPIEYKDRANEAHKWFANNHQR